MSVHIKIKVPVHVKFHVKFARKNNLNFKTSTNLQPQKSPALLGFIRSNRYLIKEALFYTA